MRTARILALLEAAEMLHGLTVRRAVLAENAQQERAPYFGGIYRDVQS